ncbi:MAG: Hsp20/alpha crystallin family protein [Theionarchaea archaeon]|nr:Hsp20/alpha crystallin family protein [Theionarchaea archaeon]
MSEDPFEIMQKRMARLERKMEELFEEALQPSWSLEEKALEPLYDIEEMENEIVVTADLPCVRDKNDLEVNCTESTLEIQARMCQPVSFKKWGTVQRDADFECFRKIISLPAEVDPDRARASLKAGILTVRLPKRIRRRKVRII